MFNQIIYYWNALTRLVCACLPVCVSVWVNLCVVKSVRKMILLWLAFMFRVMCFCERNCSALNLSVQKHTCWSRLHTKRHRAYSQSYANSLEPWHTNITILLMSRKWLSTKSNIVSVSCPTEMLKYSHALQKTLEGLFIWTKIQQLNSKIQKPGGKMKVNWRLQFPDHPWPRGAILNQEVSG